MKKIHIFPIIVLFSVMLLFSFKKIAYAGESFKELNNNIPEFTEEQKKSTKAFETYSELDALGRCGPAFVNACRELMPEKDREEIGHIKPTGWHTVKYKDLIDGNYLYNRCHLIAYQIGGENANEKNLITGTRYLNVEGMLYFEKKVLRYLDKNDNHVLYRVTPYFEGDNLVATGVQMEAWSVEDEGKGVCFNVFCYNIQPGIEIDYSTGESRQTDGEIYEKADEEVSQILDVIQKVIKRFHPDNIVISQMIRMLDFVQNVTGTKQAAQTEFIKNKNSKIFHLPSCESVSQMKEKNKEYVTDTIEEIKAEGYSPCKNCLKGYQ